MKNQAYIIAWKVLHAALVRLVRLKNQAIKNIVADQQTMNS
jgi:hypothetical protein